MNACRTIRLASLQRTATRSPSYLAAPVLALLIATACSDSTVQPVAPLPTEPAFAVAKTPSVVVNTLADDVDPYADGAPLCSSVKCTLRQAVASAPSGANITFSPTLCGGAPSCEIALDLANGSLQFYRLDADGNGTTFAVTVNGPTQYALTIGSTGAFSQSPMMVVGGPSLVTMRNLTITGGRNINSGGYGCTCFGGAIGNGGNLTLENVVLRDNVSGTLGGAVDNLGRLELRNSTVTGNTSGQGGGIWNDAGATLILTNSEVTGNVATAWGGGIAGNGLGSLTLQKKSCVSGNSPDDIVDAGATTGSNCQ